jgi:hypothetical protein
VARTAFTHARSSGKRNRVGERWEQRGFSPADLPQSVGAARRLGAAPRSRLWPEAKTEARCL